MNEHNSHPPQWPLRFLRWFCPAELHEAIEGDLVQRFQRDVKGYGVKKAQRKLTWTVVRFFRPGILFRNRLWHATNPFYMFNHFFKIFFRNSLKNSGYSLINISGLATGLACSIFIFLWVIDEISFDEFHEHKNRIFKVMANHAFDEGTQTYDDSPGPLAAALKTLPEVEESCRLAFGNKVLLQYEDKSIYENAIYADPGIFQVFTIPIRSGDPDNPISDNNSIAISQSLAEKYFSDESPIGKIFRMDNVIDAKVTAVFDDVPGNSSIKFDFIIPYQVYAKTDPYNEEWGAWTGGATYVKLHERANVEVVNNKIHDAFTKPNIWVRWDSNVELFLFPMADWRLYGNFQDGKQAGGRIKYVTAFTAVAVFILLIACVNFINIATARSMGRSREIGVRKVVGAARRSLIKQFIGESVLISFISLFFALLFVHLLLPFFNDLTKKHIFVDYTTPAIAGGLVAITLLTGLIAGSYPALLLSSFKPVEVLKGKSPGLSGASLRKALVVFQFSLSIVLIICAGIIYQQIDYMKTKELGFDKDNVFYFSSNRHLQKHFDSFRNDLLQDPAVKTVARSNANPMDVFSGIVLADNAWPGKSKEDDIVFKLLRCDYDLLPCLDFTVLDGRNFSRAFPADSNNYIISETAALRMNLTDPVGQYLLAPRKGQIIGVIKDFHSTSMRGPIEPVIISLEPERTGQVFIRYERGQLEKAMESVEAAYKQFAQGFPLEYAFMDQTFTRQYQDEITAGNLSTCFMAMAIFISCLGLFGLSAFTTGQRAKEIGVRKVMGATTIGLISMLCGVFIRPVLVSLLISLPVAWWVMQQILSGYAFHTSPGIGIFLATAILVILIAMLTVSFQTARAALANPVKSLQSE